MKFLLQQPLSASLMKHSDTQDGSVLSMLGSIHSQHHLDASIDVPASIVLLQALQPLPSIPGLYQRYQHLQQAF